ncbi:MULTISPECIES: heme exporter protein CcmD [unclassified Psychrobacter]|uniref:heme exporter protein CcmD n=1 Tax=unclassified Psychrobacter TaxID=196806 RepID=UPI000B7F6CAF|nr:MULTISPECIES: heme exporter protein CcmD [unclassified Psychrobacter]MDE4455496.1 heme exporter protein CcmD [Psychrobacter sp. DAB_AL62B]OXL25519.1 heme exporter protein CcmD [Psychrobacter sp. DAB_AL32B]
MQPYFYSVSEFIAMGEHGVFVWSCWAITVGVMLVFIIYSRRQRQALIKQLTIQQARQAQRTAKPSVPATKHSAS